MKQCLQADAAGNAIRAKKDYNYCCTHFAGLNVIQILEIYVKM